MSEEVTVEAPETEVTDESTTVVVNNIETPPAEEENQAAEDAAMLELRDHIGRVETRAEEAHARVDALIATLAEQAEREDEEESQVAEPPTETVVEGETIETEGEATAEPEKRRGLPGWL